MTRGERESFSWTHFTNVLGSGDENPGRFNCPVPPPGVLAVSEQTKKEKQSESVAAQNVFSLLGVDLRENKPPSEFWPRRCPCKSAARRGGIGAPCGEGTQIKGREGMKNEKL